MVTSAPVPVPLTTGDAGKVVVLEMNTWYHWPLVIAAPVVQRVLVLPSSVCEGTSAPPVAEALAVHAVRVYATSVGADGLYTLSSAMDHQLLAAPVCTILMYRADCAD